MKFIVKYLLTNKMYYALSNLNTLRMQSHTEFFFIAYSVF